MSDADLAAAFRWIDDPHERRPVREIPAVDLRMIADETLWHAVDLAADALGWDAESERTYLFHEAVRGLAAKARAGSLTTEAIAELKAFIIPRAKKYALVEEA